MLTAHAAGAMLHPRIPLGHNQTSRTIPRVPPERTKNALVLSSTCPPCPQHVNLAWKMQPQSGQWMQRTASRPHRLLGPRPSCDQDNRCVLAFCASFRRGLQACKLDNHHSAAAPGLYALHSGAQLSTQRALIRPSYAAIPASNLASSAKTTLLSQSG